MTDLLATESNITVIFNPASGTAPTEEELRDRLGTNVRLVPTTEADPGIGQTMAALEGGAEVVVACGGDGTVRAVAEALAGTDTALGLLPFGTGNLLASNLGLPNGFEAHEAIAEPTRRRLDVGRANGEVFTVMAGSGFDAEMMADTSSTLKHRIGTAAYVLTAFRHLRDRREPTIVEIDGERWFRGRTAMVLIGNFGTISGGVELFPDAEPDDGVLDVLVLSTSNLREWAAVAWRILRRRSLDSVAAERASGRRIVVTTVAARRWELDGEEREPTHRLEVSVEPASLSVCAGGHDA